MRRTGRLAATERGALLLLVGEVLERRHGNSERPHRQGALARAAEKRPTEAAARPSAATAGSPSAAAARHGVADQRSQDSFGVDHGRGSLDSRFDDAVGFAACIPREDRTAGSGLSSSVVRSGGEYIAAPAGRTETRRGSSDSLRRRPLLRHRACDHALVVQHSPLWFRDLDDRYESCANRPGCGLSRPATLRGVHAPERSWAE
jgi:hypothetical protein